MKACECGNKLCRDHCDEKSCSEEYCYEKNRQRRAKDIRRRLEADRRGRAVLYTVLTVPPRLREAAADKKTWRKWIDRIRRYMKNHLGLAYAVERTDPAGEDGETWHPHVNLLWLRGVGLSGWLNPNELEGLKAAWKRVIGEHPENPISVNHAFCLPERSERDRNKYWHWCRYLGRPWPRWEEDFPYHLRLKWLGNAPKTPEDTSDPCCPKCGCEVVTLAFGTLEEAQKYLAFDYTRLKDEADWRRFEKIRNSRRWKEDS